MIIGIGEIEQKDMDLTRTQKLHCAVKTRDGRLEVDARKWMINQDGVSYRSSHKGLQLKPEDWKRAIPLIQELIASAEAKTVK